MYIEVDKADLARINRAFKRAGKAPQRLKNAINRTATQAKKMLVAGRSAGYTVKAGRFNQDIRLYRASAGRHDATIKSKGRPPTIKNFKTTAPKSGGKADIVKTGLKQIAPNGGGKAFIGPGGKIAGLMVKRTSKVRNSIKVLHGPSVPKMVEKIYKGERGGQGNMEPRIKERLHKEIMAELEKLI